MHIKFLELSFMINQLSRKPLHPGFHIKHDLLPSDLTITKAAELLGIGRPALSNLLNGNASLSADMAMRLERAFGAEASKLLEMQAKYDEQLARESTESIVVRKYVPVIHQISALQIANWADQIDARQQLPALLRTLVCSTDRGLTAVDFPAFENSQRKGWDGSVSAVEATPWIPKGDSGWELSCNQKPQSKAESDYRKRISKIPASERQSMTYVFVTPRDWPKKHQWVSNKRELGHWNDVRVYDASDLEQWLEQSVQGQLCMRKFLGLSENGLTTLEEEWEAWSHITEPNLPRTLFARAVKKKAKLENWLNSSPTRPFVVKAESLLEAVAFVSCALKELDTTCSGTFERAVVVRDVKSFKWIASNPTNILVIVASSEVEERLAGFCSKSHTIIVRGRNTLALEFDVELDLLSFSDFQDAMAETGLSASRVAELGRESARSPTILRRRLAQIESIKTPPWGKDREVACALVPLMLIGVWDSSKKADREVLELLTNGNYDDVERNVAWLQTISEAPIWSKDNFRGIVSKIDVLYAVSQFLTENDLEDFFIVAELVLSEDDPSVELPPDKRWAANIYEKIRSHSDALRRSICDSLVMLAVHCDSLIGDRLSINLETLINTLVRNLLTPSTKSNWYSQREELSHYAEASPNTFLEIIERDLTSESPQVSDLFRPVGTEIFDECPRSGLLWALEVLAWDPGHLVRVVRILARLCKWKLDDNWANKPIESLKSVFRFWMPQTSASIEQRNQLLEVLVNESPSVGWQICIDQLIHHRSVGHYSSRPRWRTNSIEESESVTCGEARQVTRKAAELALAWTSHDHQTLGDLASRAESLNADHRLHLWETISDWSNSDSTPDDQRAKLRERIRRSVRIIKGSNEIFNKTDQEHIRQLRTQLQPNNLIARHRWLFQASWIPHSAQECLDANFDYDARDDHISQLRRSGLAQILAEHGLEGIKELCRTSEAPNIVGEYMVEILNKTAVRVDFVTDLLPKQSNDLHDGYDQCISGFLAKLDMSDRDQTLKALTTRYRSDKARLLRVFNLSSFNQVTWRYVDEQTRTVRKEYWTNVVPRWCDQDASEIARCVDELIDVERPMAAFHIACLRWEYLDTSRIVDLLLHLANSREKHEYTCGTIVHEVSSALDRLETRADILREELARIEFIYIEALVHTEHGVRNLEYQIAHQPEWFVQLLELVYKRSDGENESNELDSRSPEYSSAITYAAFRTLTSLSKIPGSQKGSYINQEELISWLKKTRALALERGRLEVADKMIGQLFAHCPSDEDGMWPCRTMREILDELRSEDISQGMEMGVNNLRGVTTRETGGDQERVLEEKYRSLARKIEYEHPFTAKMLEQIADNFKHQAEFWDNQEIIQQRLEY